MTNVLQTMSETGQFKIFVAAAKVAELDKILDGSKDLTIFAPTDEAFADLTWQGIDQLFHDSEMMSTILRYHIVQGQNANTKPGLNKNIYLETLLGRHVSLNKAKVEDARIMKPDITCSNGIIKVIDSVLLPRNGGN